MIWGSDGCYTSLKATLPLAYSSAPQTINEKALEVERQKNINITLVTDHWWTKTKSFLFIKPSLATPNRA